MGRCDGAALGISVGSRVGLNVGDSEGALVMGMVGFKLGARDGALVVGPREGARVGGDRGLGGEGGGPTLT